MRPPRHIARALSALASLAVLGCVWFFFAPAALGGSTSYVVTDGISMEPRFHAGDLVAVRGESDYRVGQIVAYRNRQLGTIVLHRIVGRDGSRYVFKGDNNNFLDFEHPARNQLIGALWLHVPGLGGDLASVRSPALIGGLFALGTLLLGGAAFTRRRRRRRRERRNAMEPVPSPAAGAMFAGPAPLTIAVALAAISPFVVLALIAFTRPPSALISSSVPYSQQGQLSYSAHPAPGPAYPAEGVRTGDPVFTHVVRDLGLAYAYRFKSTTAHSVSGHASLTATVTSTSGWKTTIPLAGATPFRGDEARVSARLDIGSLLALISRVESITGVRGSYTLTVTPRVKVSGKIGGAPLSASFSPAGRFSINALEIRPVTATGSTPESTEPAALFAKSATGTATARGNHPAHLSFGALSLSVASARAIALGGIAVVACALAAALALARPRRRRDETDSILARYGSLIVPVECVWQLPGVAVIDVADIDALARIAGRYERSILHERTEYGDAFWVSDESGQFRYAVWEQPAFEEWSAEDLIASTPVVESSSDERVDGVEAQVAAGTSWSEPAADLEIQVERTGGPTEWDRAVDAPPVATDLRRGAPQDTLQYGAVSRSTLTPGWAYR